jgi:hypothetical protein
MPRSRPGKIPLSGGCPRRIGGRAGAPSLDKWVDGRWPRSGLSDLGSAMPYRCAPPLCLLPQTKYSSHSAKGAKSYQPRPPAWVKTCAKTQRAESPTHRVFQSHQTHPTPLHRTESPIRGKLSKVGLGPDFQAWVLRWPPAEESQSELVFSPYATSSPDISKVVTFTDAIP